MTLVTVGHPDKSAAESAKDLRRALGAFATGVTVVTTCDSNGHRHGLTVNSFASVSLDPPLVLWSQSLKAPSYPVFAQASFFAVNVLAEDQVDLSARFSRGGDDKFMGLSVDSGAGGVPLLQGCAARFECRSLSRHPGGDHEIFIGLVEHFERSERDPLIFGGGRYLKGQPLAPSIPPAEASVMAYGDAGAIRMARRAAARLAHDLQETLCICVWGNHGPTIVHWEEAGAKLSNSLRAGLVLPVLGSATGRLFAAWLPREITAPFLATERSTEAFSNVQLDALSSISRDIRSGGQSVVQSKVFPDMYGGDVDAVSVPVGGRDGKVILAITAVRRAGAQHATWAQQVGRRLKEVAGGLSRDLGALPDSMAL